MTIIRFLTFDLVIGWFEVKNIDGVGLAMKFIFDLDRGHKIKYVEPFESHLANGQRDLCCDPL